MKKIITLFILLFAFYSFGQQTKKADFKTLDAVVAVNFDEKSVSGSVTYSFDVLNNIDTIKIDAKNMIFKNVKINNKKAGFSADSNYLKLYKGYKKGKNTVTFEYEAKPKQTLYFTGEGEGMQIWTQGQGKYTSHWLPSFDDMNEKLIFNISVRHDKKFDVIANGVLIGKSQQGNSVIWHYKMDKPMSSYLVMMAIGQFKKQVINTASGTPMELYYRPEDEYKYEPTYRYSKQIFDYLEKEIGVNYPWGVYRQIPVKDFLYAGMENTTSTIFAQDFVVDSIGFNDKTYVNVNAHELAHQWFGDMITATSGKHHWLQEGFATYYALLAEKELFGDDYFNWKLYEIAERIQQASKTDTIPILNEKASSLSFYQKGAWALHVLREDIGHSIFREAVKNYIEKHAYKNVVTDDFFAEINKISNYDTKAFSKRWLEKGTFEVQEAIALLLKNDFIKNYFEFGTLQERSFEENRPVYEKVLQSEIFYPAKEEVIFQIANVPFEEKKELIRLGMNTHHTKVRQAIARTMPNVPAGFIDEYKTLLNDPSYITREIALNVLCSTFPEKQNEFLDLSKGWVGFNDKNLRILWLTLAYTAPDYEKENKTLFYNELLGYATPEYESGIRQNALANLLYLEKTDTIILQNLVNATLHYKWQFSKFGRESIRSLIKKENHRKLFENLMPELSLNEQQKLQQLLNE